MKSLNLFFEKANHHGDCRRELRAFRLSRLIAAIETNRWVIHQHDGGWLKCSDLIGKTFKSGLTLYVELLNFVLAGELVA